MMDLGFVLLLALIAAGLGLRLLRWLDPEGSSGGEDLALALPIGLGALALATLALGEAGILGPAGIVTLLALCAALGVPGKTGPAHLLSAAARALGGARPTRDAEPEAGRARPAEAAGAILFGLGALTVAGTVLTALAPVTDGDALCYHLQVPKVFLGAGAVGFEPDLHETVYPLLTEMLYAIALACRGPVACRLIQWVLGLAFAANVSVLARPSLGRRAWWAGAIALLVPAVSNGMSAPLNDVALAAFGAATLAAWSRFDARPGRGTALLVGALAGMTLGVKYPALAIAGLVGLAIVGSSLRRAAGARAGLRSAAVHGSIFVATALLVGGGWYLRAYLATGNPVYPFFRAAFGGAGLDEVLDPIKRPLSPTPWNLLIALGPMTLRPGRFDSFSHQFGPVFLVALPALLVERAPRRVLALAAIGQAFLMLCLTQRQSMRFVLFAVGPWSVAVAWLAAVWCGRRSVPSRLLLALLAVALGFEASLAAARARHGLGVVLGREPAGRFLARREPTYRVGRWIDANLPAGARLVGQDHRGYYIPRPYTMELAHRRRTGLGRRGESASQIAAQLGREGYTHVLLCPPVPETAVEFDPTLGRQLAPWLSRRTPVYTEALTDADGVARRYAIYELTGVEATACRGREERR